MYENEYLSWALQKMLKVLQILQTFFPSKYKVSLTYVCKRLHRKYFCTGHDSIAAYITRIGGQQYYVDSYHKHHHFCCHSQHKLPGQSDICLYGHDNYILKLEGNIQVLLQKYIVSINCGFKYFIQIEKTKSSTFEVVDILGL